MCIVYLHYNRGLQQQHMGQKLTSGTKNHKRKHVTNYEMTRYENGLISLLGQISIGTLLGMLQRFTTNYHHCKAQTFTGFHIDTDIFGVCFMFQVWNSFRT